MGIVNFLARYGGDARPIREIMAEWQVAELRHLLDTASGTLPQPRNTSDRVTTAASESLDSAVLIGDFIHGRTLLDQIPTELRSAFVALMGDDPNDLRGMRARLVECLTDSDGDFMPFNDPRVVGFVNKVKGQIGENLFQRQVGNAAALATSASQEGWDVAIRQADGTHEYVQVKLYQSASGVVRHMKEVQQKVLDGSLEGIDREKVSMVYFAVPEDIHDDVRRLAEQHAGLKEMVYDKSIPISPSDAAKVVNEGLSTVGPDQLTHFFGELLRGAVIAGSLHSLVHGFLWYKGSKEFEIAVVDAVADTAISTLGIATALVAEAAFDAAVVAGGIGSLTRLFLKRAARSRWDFADFLNESLADTHKHLAVLAVR